MVAFPPPPVTLRQRGSTCVELHRPLWRVLALGFHSFLSEWLEKVSQPSLAEPFGSNLGRQWNQQPPVFPLARASPHRLPIPSSVSKAVTFVTEALYPTGILASTFSVFYFCELRKIISAQALRRLNPSAFNDLACFRGLRLTQKCFAQDHFLRFSIAFALIFQLGRK